MDYIFSKKGIYTFLCLCAALHASGSFAKHAFTINNKTPYLKISHTHLPEVPSMGPTDFVVFQNRVAVLDSEKHAISVFNARGDFIKRIPLPSGYYQRLIRDHDNTLFAFADKNLSTLIVKITSLNFDLKLGLNLLQKELPINISHMISNALMDDEGLSFESSSPFNININALTQNLSSPSSIFEEIHEGVHTQKLQTITQTIARDCFSCNPQRSKGIIINGVTYQITYSNDSGHNPSLFIGKNEIKLNQIYKNAGTHIEQVDSDGTAWVQESVFLNKHRVITYILKIAASGEIQAIFRLPQPPVNDYVMHSIAISRQGEVWVMHGHSKGLRFDIINALPEDLQHQFFEADMAVSLKKEGSAHKTELQQSQAPPRPSSWLPCQSRKDMFARGLQYYQHYQCYQNKAIVNDLSCPGRSIPAYLIGNPSNCLFSVSYSWGGFDSVATFGEKVERMKAGNTNTAYSPLPTCTTGVDCSGFVSRVWGLASKWSTNQIFNNTETISMDKMNTGDVFVKPNNHVMIFIARNHDKISTFEAIVRPGKVIVSEHEAAWFVQHGYTPKIAFNVCHP